MQYQNTPEFSQAQDENDPLRSFRSEFIFPQHEDKDVIYLCGNSLGLQPKSVRAHIDIVLDKWADQAVEGHFQEPEPWIFHHKLGKETLAKIVGAKSHEVVAMNNLTTNLHMMLASFYQPKENRKKILIESGAFPSDHFAVTTHMLQKGTNPETDLIELTIPEDGYLANEVIIERIKDLKDELALVMLPGIQYYTGQFFDIKSITSAAHSVGAYVGFDLAHAAGNVALNLHNDNVDFAVWCSYKYMNSGPGNLSGTFIHENHGMDTSFPRLGGWWGQDESIRFKMENKFQPMKGVDGWMISNGNVISAYIHLASLEIFDKAGMDQLREKSEQLTGYLEYLLHENELVRNNTRCLTPKNPNERGCQLSLYLPNHGKSVFDYLIANGVVLDWREPNVIRVAPVPIYNTFTDVRRFVKILNEAITQASH